MRRDRLELASCLEWARRRTGLQNCRVGYELSFLRKSRSVNITHCLKLLMIIVFLEKITGQSTKDTRQMLILA